MHSLLYPVCNEREAMRRQGLKPKDHAKENRRRLEELQRQKVIVTFWMCFRDSGAWDMDRANRARAIERFEVQSLQYKHKPHAPDEEFHSRECA